MRSSIIAIGAALLAALPTACRQPTAIRPASAPPAPIAAPLVPGDIVPNFSFVDHAGAARSLHDSPSPRATLVTFIFTRCSMMEFCPRMSLKFQEVRQALDASPAGQRIELISITLDPAHDSPDALATYATTFDAQVGRWTFARCEPEVLAGMQSQFGVRATPTGPGGAIEHNLITALIAPDRQLRRIWEGNGWATEEIVAAAQAVLTSNPPPVAVTPPVR